MGALDRLNELDHLENEEYLSDEEVAVNHVIATSILALLTPFVPADDGFSNMLLGLARRFLADADERQLREVVVELCKAADTLRPYIVEGGTLAIEAHTSAGADIGKDGPDSGAVRAG